MNRFLLAVNVLIAMAWPRHRMRGAAKAWVAASADRGWATNAITQIGLLRLLTKPAITNGGVEPSAALRSLDDMVRHPAHGFWRLERPVAALLGGRRFRIRGHRHWTATLLLAQAIERQGVLVTFDAGLKDLAGPDQVRHLLVLA